MHLNESAVCWCCAVTDAGIIMVISNCSQLRVQNFVRKKGWTRRRLLATGFCSQGWPLPQPDKHLASALAVWADWAPGRLYITGDTDVLCDKETFKLRDVQQSAAIKTPVVLLQSGGNSYRYEAELVLLCDSGIEQWDIPV
jgi:hypothetical protein